MPKTKFIDLDTLIHQLRDDFPEFNIVEGINFSWHAGRKRLSFKRGNSLTGTEAQWSLLHEIGHALLQHANYQYDLELVQLESAAWVQARNLAVRYKLTIDEDHIQDCLDTYRDWLHSRSTCPLCFTRTLQDKQNSYRCMNCRTAWKVSRSRLCRPYRLQTA